MTGSILVVDSVATNRIVLKTALATAQYNVLSCASCAEAKEIIAQLRKRNLSREQGEKVGF